MFRNFFELKDELLAKGEKFSEVSLKQLSYSDLNRAAIGDAGNAACDLELVEIERNIRLNDAEFQFVPTEYARGQGMLEDLLLRRNVKKMAALPAWDSLSPIVQLYFCIRCLRAHADVPGPRLLGVLEALDAMDLDATTQADDALEIYGKIVDATCALQATEAPTIQQIREAYRGCDGLLRYMTDWERGLCLNLTVNGYTCTGGCFLPTTFES